MTPSRQGWNPDAIFCKANKNSKRGFDPGNVRGTAKEKSLAQSGFSFAFLVGIEPEAEVPKGRGLELRKQREAIPTGGTNKIRVFLFPSLFFVQNI